MLTTAQPIAFLATSDAARARAFYEDVLGLTLGLTFVADEYVALVFDLNGVMLRIAKVQEVTVAPYTALGWHVADIASTVRQLSERGVSFERYPSLPQDDLGIWTTPDGSKVAWFKDPEGHTLSLTQF